ncbi:AMP-binding protein [Corynebacterium lizhenjunii]|uniref:AMP-binding protein n=1 Tax=Corynebacterium lizhenjunii TaxID=2709394 RepID=A0A7T0P9T9_9CORY|nr:AMP-binding protein [Corynebacterium lizhenjunii]QPK79108.1 AMP-binding protein [Corynebacterium lizhenjunii]
MLIYGTQHNANELDIGPCNQLYRHAKYSPERPALVYEGQTYTYREFTTEVRKWAAHFEQAGVNQGDRVGYIGLNSRSFLFAMFGAWWVGATFMPFNFRLSAPETAKLFLLGTPHTVVVEGSHLAKAKNVFGIERHHVVVVDDDPAAPVDEVVPLYWSATSSFEELDTSMVMRPRAVTMEDLALLLFTSGTTGLPKGAELTFGNLWWNSINVDSMVDTRPGDYSLATAPLFHVGALNSFAIRSFFRGNTLVVHRKFDPEITLRDMVTYKIASVFLVPAQLAAMEKAPSFESSDLSTLRAVICAGAPVPPAIIRRFADKGVSVQQAWGLTETSPFATYLPPEMTQAKLGSCGIPMPHTQVRLMNPDTGVEVKDPHVTGEMWVKGPNVAVGYWNNPEMTQKAYTAGWFRSGDIGYMDEDGYFYIVDRLKDMIISGGENVYPAEVERILAENDTFARCAVVGIPDEKWGERIVAVIEHTGEIDFTVQDIRDHCARHLARYKLPSKVVVVDEIPRNAGGKVDKILLRQGVREGTIGEVIP